MQDAHNDYDITDFHGALLDIISVMNQPLRDEQILQAAGIQLEQMLFPLLVAVGRHGPVGVVELADHLGRDYTTVSRQVKKLEAQGLACKQPNRHDRRISEVTLSASGQQMIDSIAVARRRLMNQVLAQWPEEEVQALFRLTRKYADSFAEIIAAWRDARRLMVRRFWSLPSGSGRRLSARRAWSAAHRGGVR
ncbi:putative regulatory protein MarR [Klebsiella pneumoniae]|uniref:Regulatory protein MarR n=3 Tax=Enterobacteriaceae TaxID=543 RepID=A0AB74GT43_KLEPN|nr:putative regulatory protein MarR [Klebsiella pneumoniae]